MKFHAKHFAFSYGYPATVSYLKQYFKELQQVRFAQLGPDNKPDGNIIESSIDRFPELIRQYPYVKNVIRLKKGEILHFRSIASSFFSDEINRLIELIGNVQDSWLFGTSGKEIQQAIRDIEKEKQIPEEKRTKITEVLALLGKNDIVTHAYHGKKDTYSRR